MSMLHFKPKWDFTTSTHELHPNFMIPFSAYYPELHMAATRHSLNGILPICETPESLH